MLKKIVISSIIVVIIAIGIFVYLHNKEIDAPIKVHTKYSMVKFKGSIYPENIMIKNGSTLKIALIELYKIDHKHYDTYIVDKKEVSENFKIFKDCIVTIK